MQSLEQCLIVIDVQNDFCHGGALAVPDGDTIVPVVNALMPGFQSIVLTQDWHCQNHISFASHWPGQKPFDEIDNLGYAGMLWPDHCVRGSQGACFHPGLDTAPARLIIRKGQNPLLDSYSAFFENDRRSPTGLSGWLSALGITRIFVAGLATDYCVASTVQDALALGLAVTVIEDAIRPVSRDTGEAALSRIKSQGAKFVESAKVRSP